MFSAQYLCKPIPSGQGLCDPSQIKWFGRDIVGALIGRLRLHVTIDLAGMESDKTRTDFTVITMAGFDRDGRPYILEIRRGHFTPFEVINHIFDLHKTYPAIMDFKIEKDAHARVLLPFMQREMSKRQKFPMMVPLRRDNRTSKEHRIRALQPWFETGAIRFVDDISCKIELINEIARFPKYAHDDILDTLADQMQNRDSDGVVYDVFPDPPKFEVGNGDIPSLRNRFLGFERGTGREEWLFGDKPSDEENPNYQRGTGL
jgi:predicted phage terminase large subunit-like protein